MNLENFLEQIKTWASSDTNIESVLLAGSQARGEAKPDSDIDLVLLCKNPAELLSDLSWINTFGDVDQHIIEHWGEMLQSVRVFYQRGPEVEFGITSTAWAKLPVDPGTAQVLAGDAKIIVDKTGVLEKLIAANKK